MEGYIGEIRLFAGNFAPRGWVFCNGNQYSIAEYNAAYSILGSVFGGNDQTYFNVPDLCGRVAVGTGQGNGLSNISLGQKGGNETVVMTTSQMPAHTHTANATITFPSFSEGGNSGSSQGAILAGLQGAYSTDAPDTFIAPAANSGTLSPTGGNLPFGIVQPIMVTNYIICLVGIYPSRN